MILLLFKCFQPIAVGNTAISGHPWKRQRQFCLEESSRLVHITGTVTVTVSPYSTCLIPYV